MEGPTVIERLDRIGFRPITRTKVFLTDESRRDFDLLQ